MCAEVDPNYCNPVSGITGDVSSFLRMPDWNLLSKEKGRPNAALLMHNRSPF
jgi:hypothetical protein